MHSQKIRLIAILLVLAMTLGLFASCAGDPDPTGTSGSTGSTTQPSTPAPTDPEDPVDKSVYMDPTRDIEERVEALLAQMTLDEKIGQMVQPEQAAISVADVTKYGFGSVLSGGGSPPSTGNTAEDWQKRVNDIKQAALETRLGIPALYGVDAVHGHGNVYGSTVYPHNIALGATGDADLVERIAAAVAEETRATGIQWIFAPTLANPQNELWGRTYEGFSEDAALVAELGAAFVQGAQGTLGTDDFLSPTHTIGTAKHYIGEGYTTAGTNQGNVHLPGDAFETLLRETLLVPYKAAVDAGVRTVMVSFNSVNDVKCHENGYLITTVLKGDLGFTGLVVGDYNGVQQVSGSNYKEQIANCVNAGVDILMEPYSWKDTISNLKKAVEDGSVPMERIDDAVTRILRVKFEAGLFEEELYSDTEMELLENFGSTEHREIAREAVRKSLVLLKNDSVGGQTAMEALQGSSDILVVGSKADDIGAQCGGWTITWQGSTGDIIEGTTLLEGLQNAAGNRTITHNTDGAIEGSEDAIIVVLGETPYAETAGDRSTTSLTISNDDKTLISNMKDDLAQARANGVPTILVLYSGRPITIAEYVDQFDAIVAAWLPGTEGDGIADVLLGDYDFTGTLSYTWPWYASDIEAKFDDPATVLFANGTGLTKNGQSIKPEGTVTINEKPVKSPEEIAMIAGGAINLESTGYVLEAENFNSNSYLVQRNNENNISFVDNWSGQWANTKWDVYVPKTGTYTMHFYIASNKNSNCVEIYYASPSITDDNNANKTPVPITKTESLMHYEDFTLEVYLTEGTYEFKFMTNQANGADFRLDKIEFEFMGE